MARSNRLDAHKHRNAGKAPGAAPKTAAPIAKTAPTNHLLEAMQAQMDIHRGRLASVPVIEDKLRMKREFLPVYDGFVNDYVTQGENYPNDVAVQVMIWRLDVGDIEHGLGLALYLIDTKVQQLPPKFDRRDLETFVCDAVYDWANAMLKGKQSATPYLDTVVARMSGQQWPVHPAVASKMYTILAKHKFAAEQYRECVDLCKQAQVVNPEGAGVKTLLANALAKLPAES